MSDETKFEIGNKAEQLYYSVFDLTTNRQHYPVKFRRLADKLGEKFAMENGIKLQKFPADWVKFGKSTGFIRNNQMLEFIQEPNCEGAVLAFWDGKSHGTKHTITTAKKQGVETVVYRIDEREDKQ